MAIRLAEAVYAQTHGESTTFRELMQHKQALGEKLLAARSHWAAHPADKASRVLPDSFKPLNDQLVDAVSVAADLFYEDVSGERSLTRRLQRLANRFDVCKLPYVLSNTMVYRRQFVFNVPGKDPWDYFVQVTKPQPLTPHPHPSASPLIVPLPLNPHILPFYP